MLPHFESIDELLVYFESDKAGHDFLAQRRWNGNVSCPYCGAGHSYFAKEKYICRDKICKKRFSLLKGTFLRNPELN